MILGVSSLAISVMAIELLIHWNHLQNAYSLKSTGQYLAFSVGLLTLPSSLWGLVRQKVLSHAHAVLLRNPLLTTALSSQIRSRNFHH
ncbi:hypothetical protein F5X68DRAFT_198510 [Plectosphaerella plurivora]|uniref:Uncharacterized protein n=1 Tax=Plectosphaerella plurivora TaxID=936078 RepID=A0A9P9AGD6_9PEZI|nr:hypothetical protein F5X68DRAFT_198510 [Plectosphaerella plurivora]